VLIMTSNLGTEFARRGGALGFVQSGDEQAVVDHQKIERALRDTFRPEFLNRIDEIIIFSPLALADVERMVDLQMKGLTDRLTENGLTIHLTEPARHWLAKTGYDANFGARPLRRAIQRYVENPLSVRLLRGDFQTGDVIVIDEVNGEIVFTRDPQSYEDFSSSTPLDLSDGNQSGWRVPSGN
jgi:ATP-dependent Clp protease ATP-binding subunit ClpC